MNDSDTNKQLRSNPHLWASVEIWFAYLNLEFDFTLDPYYSGTGEDRPKFYAPEDYGLLKPWESERVFVHPPCGLCLPLWLTKAYFESNEHGALVVCLVRASSLVAWWQESELKATELRTPRGQAKAVGKDEAEAFAVNILIFEPRW